MCQALNTASSGWGDKTANVGCCDENVLLMNLDLLQPYRGLLGNYPMIAGCRLLCGAILARLVQCGETV